MNGNTCPAPAIAGFAIGAEIGAMDVVKKATKCR
jgi:hypothetical protein